MDAAGVAVAVTTLADAAIGGEPGGVGLGMGLGVAPGVWVDAFAGSGVPMGTGVADTLVPVIGSEQANWAMSAGMRKPYSVFFTESESLLFCLSGVSQR